MQVYAPFTELDRAFHRTLFIFCCETGMCLNTPGSYVVLRSQLPRRNEFYDFEPAPYPAEVASRDA